MTSYSCLQSRRANDQVLPNLLPHLGENSTVCTLQNGVPEPFVAEYVGEKRTVGGTVLWGATFVEPGVSELTQDLSRNDHLFEIGEINGEITERIKTVAATLGYMGPTAVTDKLMDSRWGKLINNACMSGHGPPPAAPPSAASWTTMFPERASATWAEKSSSAARPPATGSLFCSTTRSRDTLDLADQEMFNEDQEMFLTMYSDMRTAKAACCRIWKKRERRRST